MYKAVKSSSRLNFEKRVVKTSTKLYKDSNLKVYDNCLSSSGNEAMNIPKCSNYNKPNSPSYSSKGGTLEVLTADLPSTNSCGSAVLFGFQQNSDNSSFFYKGDDLGTIEDCVVVEGVDFNSPTAQQRGLTRRQSRVVSLTVVPSDVSTLLGARDVFVTPKKQTAERRLMRESERDLSSIHTRTCSRWDEWSLGGATRSSVTRSQDSESKGPMRVNIAHKALIGKGSFGVVYQAMDLDTNHLIAVKEINFSNGADKKSVTAVRKELALLKLLDHPHIVKCLGEDCDENCLRIYLEYVSGGSVSGVLRTFGSFQEKQASIYTRQMLEGLVYLHSKNIMHRDLKGDNLLVDPNGTLKISDFGTAKHLLESNNVTAIAGTAYFMAPEVILAQGAGLASDVWSVGCCVIEMVTGRPPFAEVKNQYALMLHIAETKGDFFSEMIPMKKKLSSKIILFLQRCLQRDPSMRPTAQELLSDPWILSPPEDYSSTCCRNSMNSMHNV